MAEVRSKRGYAASHFSDTFLVNQHRRKRNAEGIGDKGMNIIDLAWITSA
jgi:hypothetical protein